MTQKVIARLKGPFSLTGEVRLQFIDIDLANYLVKNKVPLYSVLDDKVLTPIACRIVPKGIAFKFSEIPDRNASETLSKGDVTADSALLPEVDEDNYSLDDLVGLTVQKSDNIPIATVTKAYNYGASDIIECITLVNPDNAAEKPKEFTAPVSPDTVLDIDFDKKIISVTEMIDYFIIA
jgi:16S rRNA processing protein RimM